MREKIIKNIYLTLAFIVAVAFLATFGKSAILRAYIELGIGTCHQIPILCREPSENIITPNINAQFVAQLVPYVFPEIKISLPSGFTAVRGEMKKASYKKWRKPNARQVVYLLYEKPNFFAGLFPRFSKKGSKDDYDFIRRTMYARTDKVNGLADTFFVIMKSIFIPDLGNGEGVNMVRFTSGDKRGFINYNLGKKENYFDCNIIDKQGNFFKVYIKDAGATLDLSRVLAIISTVNKS